MFTGIVLPAYPKGFQKIRINQWIGCARFLWNAKCEEEQYLTQFAKRYLPIGTYAPVDQTFSQYKNEELSPWLFNCPSQILRNTATNWYATYRKFLKGECGKPKRKAKSNEESVHLTRELFQFEKGEDGNLCLFIGSKTNNIGYLSIKNYKSYKEPNSIWLKRKNGRYFIAFCYEDNAKEMQTLSEHLEYLKGLDKAELEKITMGIDRGVKRPVQAGDEFFDFSIEQKKKKKAKERYIKRCQQAIARGKKGSKRRLQKKLKMGRAYEKISNIRKDFCHKTSRSIVEKQEVKVIVLEDLRTKQMTKKPKAKKDESTRKWLPNRRKAKAGLNRSILDKGWHLFEKFIQYKAYKAGKAVFKVLAYHTSQECSDCGYTHPDNRKKQDLFVCGSCGHTENADKNAQDVIKKRAINKILDSGTELSSKGVLLDKGRGAANKTQGAKANCARGKEASKKMVLAASAA